MIIDLVPALVKRAAKEAQLALRQGLHRRAVIAHQRMRQLWDTPFTDERRGWSWWDEETRVVEPAPVRVTL